MSETHPEVTEGNPAEDAWARTAERAAEPASVSQPMTGEELVASLDRVIEDKERIARERDGIEEPKPEPPDYSTIVKTALELGVSVNDAPPNKFSGLDIEDRNAVRSRLLEIKSENTPDPDVVALQEVIASRPEREYAQTAANEIALDDARAILEAGDTPHVWQAASIVQEQHPQVFDQFMAEWSETDPDAARTWSSQHPPIDWQERRLEHEDFLADAEEEAEEQARAVQRQAISESFEKRIDELEKDPKAAPYVDAALGMIGMQLEAGQDLRVQTPAQAKTLLDASVKTAREISRTYAEAGEVAKLLGPIEERLQLQAALEVEEQTGVWPDLADREELAEQTRTELISKWGFRGPQPSAQESNEAFLAEFDRIALEKHPSLYGPSEPTAGEIAYGEELAARFEDRRRARHPRTARRERGQM